ncbi:MAG TPA: T9SS type A sorting domain-containing protein, partial [Bacteroidales bacterium]|nr:T9SS type A sorting domain-containing protein [Bacteroidales bacterium]
GENAVAVFGAPLSSLGLEGQALTIIASGFLSPADNNGGAAFGLYVALPSGGELVELQNTTSVEENQMSIKAWSIYPNPASQRATIELTEEMENAQLRVMSLTGQVLDVMNIENQRIVNLSTDRYSEGIYFINITNGSAVQTKKLQIVK